MSKLRILGNNYQNMSDSELADRLKAKDQAAWEYLYKAHVNNIVNMVIANSGTRDDGLDIFHKTLAFFELNLENNRYQPKPESRVGAYLMTIAKRQWLLLLRKKPNTLSWEDNLDLVDDTEEDTPEIRLQLLQVVLEQLSDKCKEIIIMRYGQHKISTEEIARKLSLANGDVAKATLSRCMKKARSLAQPLLEKYRNA